MSSCSKAPEPVSSEPLDIKSKFAWTEELPQNVTMNVHNRLEFELDYQYLQEIGTPNDVIESVRGQKAIVGPIVSTEDKIYYVVYYDIMCDYYNRFDIVAYNKADSTTEKMYSYTCAKEDYSVRIPSMLYADGSLYWSEELASENVHWRLRRLDILSRTVSTVDSDTASQSKIIPAISTNSHEVSWIRASNDANGNVNHQIVSLDTKTLKQTVLASNIVLENPYARPINADEAMSYLVADGDNVKIIWKSKVSNKQMELPTKCTPARINLCAASNKYIVWEELPGDQYYVNQKIIIYDIETGKQYTYDCKPDGVSTLGVGIVGDYIYINIIKSVGASSSIEPSVYLVSTNSNQVYSVTKKILTAEDIKNGMMWPFTNGSNHLYFTAAHIFDLYVK